MGWFGRRRRHEDASPPSDVLPALSHDQATRFTAAAQRAFATAGLETVPRGDGSLQAADGYVLNLHNIAHLAADVPERRWDRLLQEHVRTMVVANSTPKPESIDSVREQLFLRVFDRDDLTDEPYGREVVGDLFAVAAVDHPDHVMSLTGSGDVDRLGGWSEVEQVGLRNLRALTADEVISLDHRVEVSIGGFFNASRLLVLESVLTQDFRLERPPHGVLVAAPNRHVLAVHALAGPDCVAALQTMVALAQSQASEPGGLSSEVFFWRDGRLEQVTAQTAQDTVQIHAVGLFGAAMDELGLLTDE